MPTVLSGQLFGVNTTSTVASETIYIYNKTKDELKSGNDGSFTDLITDANGNWSVDLEDFTSGVATSDIVFITAFNGDDKKAIGRITVTAVGSNQTKDITLLNMEPTLAVTNYLRSKITDPQSSRNNTLTMIMPNWSFSEELNKNSYPRMNLGQVNEEVESFGISGKTKNIVTLKIIVGVWVKSGNFQKFTINNVGYQGPKLRDYFARQVSDKLRNGFKPNDPKDLEPLIKDFYDFEQTNFEDLEFDENKDIMEKEIEIKFSYIRTN